ncbi:MAG: hypothetical protein IPI73_17530 [Betaproteobacteria bacterium]|nr:hypothetical protein [Betaproteobacteria bacterium]
MRTPGALCAELDARDTGLTATEARARLLRLGPNTLGDASRWGAWVESSAACSSTRRWSSC